MGGAVASAPMSLLLSVDADEVKPGLLGLVVVLAMGVALFFLLRSLAKHLGRVDVDRDAREAADEEPPSPENDDGPTR
jgi:hypothetical protein